MEVTKEKSFLKRSRPKSDQPKSDSRSKSKRSDSTTRLVAVLLRKLLTLAPFGLISNRNMMTEPRHDKKSKSSDGKGKSKKKHKPGATVRVSSLMLSNLYSKVFKLFGWILQNLPAIDDAAIANKYAWSSNGWRHLVAYVLCCGCSTGKSQSSCASRATATCCQTCPMDPRYCYQYFMSLRRSLCV